MTTTGTVVPASIGEVEDAVCQALLGQGFSVWAQVADRATRTGPAERRTLLVSRPPVTGRAPWRDPATGLPGLTEVALEAVQGITRVRIGHPRAGRPASPTKATRTTVFDHLVG